jgi:hypothetical protein
MLLKIKKDVENPVVKAGMYMKTKEMSAESGNVAENTGS